MEKKEFFREPGAELIIKDKSRIIVPDLVTIIENLKPNQYYIIDHNIIPRKSKTGIPYTSKEKEGELSQRFLKRGPLIELNTPNMTLTNARNARKRILDLRREKFNNLEIDEFGIAGYGFWGIRTNYHRRFNLVSCIKGARLYAYSQLNKEESELIKILEYDLEKNRTDIGADVIAEIPSERITLPKYDITLRSVPIKNNSEKYAIIYDFDANHDCKFRSTRISKRYTTRESFIDFHICSAYLAFADRELKFNKNKVPLEMCPFAIPTQKTIDYYRKLVNNVVIMYEEDSKEVKRATNQGEREFLLWPFVDKHGHDETFYATKKLKEYKWT